MLIVGAKGFAKEVLEILFQKADLNQICFYDDISTDIPKQLYNEFRVLNKEQEVIELFRSDNRFTIGVGNPVVRYKMDKKFTTLGGDISSTISPLANIGHYGNQIGEGNNIMTGATITNDIQIGRGCLINLHCTIGHDTILGNFVEMSPGVHISGNCKIGDFCNLGTNSTILPKVSLGKNVIVGAGAVVTMDFPDNCLVVGIPATVKRELPPVEAE